MKLSGAGITLFYGAQFDYNTNPNRPATSPADFRMAKVLWNPNKEVSNDAAGQSSK